MDRTVDGDGGRIRDLGVTSGKRKATAGGRLGCVGGSGGWWSSPAVPTDSDGSGGCIAGSTRNREEERRTRKTTEGLGGWEEDSSGLPSAHSEHPAGCSRQQPEHAEGVGERRRDWRRKPEEEEGERASGGEGTCR